jgi:inhibitor of cysteine peptidase
MYYPWLVTVGGILSLLVVACSPGSKQATSSSSPPTEPINVITSQTEEVQIKHIDINVLESFPVQVNVVVTGNLPDDCTTLDQFLSERKDSIFTIKITVTHSTHKTCTKAVKSFERMIPLDVEDLKAGVYTVNVNGVTDTFELEIDNVAH